MRFGLHIRDRMYKLHPSFSTMSWPISCAIWVPSRLCFRLMTQMVREAATAPKTITNNGTNQAIISWKDTKHYLKHKLAMLHNWWPQWTIIYSFIYKLLNEKWWHRQKCCTPLENVLLWELNLYVKLSSDIGLGYKWNKHTPKPHIMHFFETTALALDQAPFSRLKPIRKARAKCQITSGAKPYSQSRIQSRSRGFEKAHRLNNQRTRDLFYTALGCWKKSWIGMSFV